MALKQIKNKIISTQKTGKVTKAMEAVSAVKMRKSQERALAGKSYAEAAVRVLARLSQSQGGEHFFEAGNGEGLQCFVVVTSDKGLAGSLNSAVLKEVSNRLKGVAKEKVRIIAFGRKALEHFTRLGYTIDQHFTNVSDEASLADMEDVTTFVTEQFKKGTYGSVVVAYQSFVSTFEQEPVVRTMLPLQSEELEKMVKDIAPTKGLHSEEAVQVGHDHVYTIEPSVEEVVKVLMTQLMQIMLYHSLLESKASEHSARMVAMKNATDKAKEITKALTIKFNKARQAVITAEVSEITGGIEAMKT